MIQYGDPKLYITNDGVDINLIDGFPEMETGLENTSVIAMYTKSGYPFNAISDNEIEKAGNDFLEQISKPITKNQIIVVQDAAEKAYAPLISEGIIRSVQATISLENGVYSLSIILTAPTGENQELIFKKYGQLWINQANTQ